MKRLRTGLLVALVLLLTGVLYGCGMMPSTETRQPPGRTDYTNYTARVLTDLEAGKVETIIEYGANLVLGAHYPSFGIPSVDQAVRRTIDRQISDFHAQNKTYKAENKDERAVLSIDFATYLPAPDHVTVLYKRASYAASLAHPEYRVFTEYYDLAAGQPETIAMLCQKDYLEFLSTYCDRHFRADPAYRDAIDPLIYDAGIAPTAENYRTLVFRNTGVEVIFQRYQVFPGNLGMPSVTIPLEAIRSFVPMYLPKQSEATPPPAEPAKPATPGRPNEPNGVDRKKPMVALTFDDGPDKKVTPVILDALKKAGGHATFFVLGKRASGFPEIVRRIAAEGHEVGNHSYSHPSLTKLTVDEIKSQISLTDASIKKACGMVPRLIRPTYGAINDQLQKTADRPLVLWSIDTRDWATRSRDKTIQRVLERVKDGDIVLMHDLYPTTGEACAQIIPKLAAKGYQLVTVSELMEAKGISSGAGKIIRQGR